MVKKCQIDISNERLYKIHEYEQGHVNDFVFIEVNGTKKIPVANDTIFNSHTIMSSVIIHTNGASLSLSTYPYPVCFNRENIIITQTSLGKNISKYNGTLFYYLLREFTIIPDFHDFENVADLRFFLKAILEYI